MDLGFMNLSRLVFGYWEGQPVFALVGLGIPDRLSRAPATAAEVAEAVGAPVDAVERLLNACVALKLLDRAGERYNNADVARRFLTGASETSLVHWIRVMGRWVRPWASLTEAIRTGAAVEPQGDRLGADPEYMRDFILGMHEYARRTGDALVPFVDAGAKTLVDVGGGAGTYAIALCQARPALRARVLDLAPVLAITRELAEREGLSDRIETVAADYRRDAFGRDVDVVLMSNVLHQEARDVCASMLERGRESLRPGGKLLVQGYFLNEERTSPSFVTLHNLSALALWEGGGSWTVPDMVDLIRSAGFEQVAAAGVNSGGFTIVSGLKPRAPDGAGA